MIMRNNRRAGNSFERYLSSLYKSIGFDSTTSRFSSREKDSQKVDLCGTDPINVQAKYTKNYPNFYELLSEMPNDGNYNIIHHKRNRGVGKPNEQIVVMKTNDWMDIIEMLKNEKLL